MNEKLQSLYHMWIRKNQDLDFYFENMFDLSLNILRSRSDNADIKGKKALFLPVGYSLENVALVSVFFRPEHLTLAISDSLRRFFRKYQDRIKENINKYAPEAKIDYPFLVLKEYVRCLQRALF